jgi:SnoaL-like protein
VTPDVIPPPPLKEAAVSKEQTRQTIDRYFTLMGDDADFAECYTADVTWLTADSGILVEGAKAVRDYLLVLHGGLVDSQTRQLVIGDDTAYLEGDCAAPDSDGGRIPFCVAYDLRGDRISAMRCYGRLG